MSVRMVEELDLTICPYCNREYINSRDEDCAGAQLDHFYNKSTYPIFSLCLYNLVPVCGNCNRIKSSKKCDFASPFDLDIDFDNGLKFSLLTDGDDITRIQIVVNEDCKKLRNNISEMKIENSYQIHRKDVLELQKKLKQYSDTQLQEMFKITNIPAIQIKEMIFGPKIDSNIMKIRHWEECCMIYKKYIKYLNNDSLLDNILSNGQIGGLMLDTIVKC